MAELLTPVRILVIEDCEDDFDLLLLMLRRAGFEPLAARVETIRETKEALARGEWQIVLSDFDLPGFKGLRALELAREADPEIPFFLVSGGGSIAQLRQQCRCVNHQHSTRFKKGRLLAAGRASSTGQHWRLPLS